MTGHIFIEREIGVETTPQSVRNNIAEYPQATEFEVHINSIGGDVYDGYQIGIILRNLGKPSTAIIEGQCASIATYDALCCDKVVMSPHGDFMIHDPTGTINGRAEDFLAGAQQLARIKSEIIDRYLPRVARKGVTREQLSAMMDRETSMSAQEALSFGFIDEVREKLKAVAKIDINKFNKMEKTITKEEVEGMFAKFGNKIDSFLNSLKSAKNIDLTLLDGTVVTSDAPDPESIVGSVVTDASGAPLADGNYETAEGFDITIAGGKVTAYEPAMEDKSGDSAKVIAELKQQIASLQEQLGAKSNEVATVVEAKAKLEKDFADGFKALKAEMNEIKTRTFGDDAPPKKGTGFQDTKTKIKNNAPDAMIDQMAELGEVFITSRNLDFLKK